MYTSLTLRFAGEFQISEQEGQFGTSQGNCFVPLISNLCAKLWQQLALKVYVVTLHGFVMDVYSFWCRRCLY